MGIDIEHDLALVMTGSVDPKGMPAAATVSDPQRREADYIATLQYYLSDHPRIRRIVFAENSGWPLDRLKEAASCGITAKAASKPAEVEFLSFQLNDFPRDLGKSYGELLLLDHVFVESKLVRGSRYVAKMTGRNHLINITQLIERAPDSLNFFCDLRDHPLYEITGIKRSARHGESRFFITTSQFYDQHFRAQYATLDDGRGITLEGLIYRVVKPIEGAPGITVRFPIEPDFRGLAGHLGKDYGSVKERSKRFVRGAVRRLAPWLRI